MSLILTQLVSEVLLTLCKFSGFIITKLFTKTKLSVLFCSIICLNLSKS